MRLFSSLAIAIALTFAMVGCSKHSDCSGCKKACDCTDCKCVKDCHCKCGGKCCCSGACKDKCDCANCCCK